MDTIVMLAAQAAFFAVFAAVVVRWHRRPTALNRDVVAVFGAVAGLFLIALLRPLVGNPTWLATVPAVLLMAQPYLTARLVRHFSALPRWAMVLALAGFLTSAGILVIGTQGNRLATLYVVGYFVVVEGMGGAQLVRAGRRRVGTARSRLVTAGVATFLFGGAVLVAGLAAVADQAATSSPYSALARLIALAAGVGYLFAFAPPRWMRRIQQQAIAFELNQELLAVPTGADPSLLWQKLAAAARRVTGARAAVIVGAPPRGDLLAEDGEWRERPVVGSAFGRIDADASPTAVVAMAPEALRPLAVAADADRTILVPLVGAGGPRGDLAVFVAGSPLFVDDDVALLSVLASRTLTAIEREEALADRTALVTTLRRTNEELARASAAKTDFLAAMSHELRTPLNSIIGFSELLMAPVQAQDGPRGLDVVDQAAHIHGAGLQLLDLINEVLDLARVEAGRLELHYETFDIAALVGRTAESMLPLADRRGVRVDVHAPVAIDVEADPGRVRQVVYNLLSNAIKFSPEGGTITVGVGRERDAVTVAVADEGPGIPRGEQAMVFEAFTQGTDGRRQAEGAGLGLALSRQLAEAHGGTIALESEPPRGSTFTLRLPPRRPEAASVPVSRDARRLVLVVEDDPGSVALLRSWLEPEGYAVSVASTGEEGIEQARKLVPDAIVLDILLPGLDGWQVMQQLRSDRRTHEVPILVVSVVEDEELGLALGAADYLVKPVQREMMLARLRWVTRARTSDEPPVVLAIDPDPEAMAAYRSALDGAARVVEAHTGARGRELAFEARPDAILLDLFLPDLAAFTLLGELKAHPATRHVPVFALTSHPLAEEDRRRLSGQVVAVLEKRDAAGGLAAWLRDLPERAVPDTEASA